METISIIVGLAVIYFLGQWGKTVQKKSRRSGKVLQSKVYEKEKIGEMGEIEVHRLLTSHPRSDHTIFRDIMISHQENETAQIDHVVISPSAIFVIETKTFKGYVKGFEQAHHWVQFLRKSRHDFYNPIKQNEKHIQVLQAVLKKSMDLEGTLFVSIVVFVGTKQVEVEVSAPNHHVVTLDGLLDCIGSYTSPILSDDQVELIRHLIRSSNQTDEEEREQHVSRIQSRKQQIENHQCPKCQNPLQERQGPYGSFLACSQYPRCRFKAKINQKNAIKDENSIERKIKNVEQLAENKREMPQEETINLGQELS